MEIINSLRAPDTCAQNIECLVETSAAPNFQFGYHKISEKWFPFPYTGESFLTKKASLGGRVKHPILTYKSRTFKTLDDVKEYASALKGKKKAGVERVKTFISGNTEEVKIVEKTLVPQDQEASVPKEETAKLEASAPTVETAKQPEAPRSKWKPVNAVNKCELPDILDASLIRVDIKSVEPYGKATKAIRDAMWALYISEHPDHDTTFKKRRFESLVVLDSECTPECKLPLASQPMIAEISVNQLEKDDPKAEFQFTQEQRDKMWNDLMIVQRPLVDGPVWTIKRQQLWSRFNKSYPAASQECVTGKQQSNDIVPHDSTLTVKPNVFGMGEIITGFRQLTLVHCILRGPSGNR
ncbi:MAG: hypothetical protein NWF07_08985 [Candidatus Bathyarchaeota archaeon]|nr:hypothetical protein [Candidatus Bathyarchaeota archaeon]